MFSQFSLKKYLLKYAPYIPFGFGVRFVNWEYRTFVVSKFTVASYMAVCRTDDKSISRILLVESWDGGLLLPGGALEQGKDASLCDAAIRELEEETGLVVSEVSNNPVTTLVQGMRVGVVFLLLEELFSGGIKEEPQIPDDSECVGFQWLSRNDLYDEEISKSVKGGMNSGIWKMVVGGLEAYEIARLNAMFGIPCEDF